MSELKPRGCTWVLALACVSGLVGCRHQPNVASSPPYTAPNVSAAAPSEEAPPAPVYPVYRKPPAPVPSAPAAAGLPSGAPASTEIVLASWYGPPYHNHAAADGSIFDQNALTVAHRTLPLGTIVRVTNLATGHSVVAKVTDRGPFVQGRTLDLSLAAAKAIDVYQAGVAQVKIEAWPNPAADPEGRWCVQIGVFLDPEEAIQLRNDLSRRYATSKVTEFTGPTGHWVRINPPQYSHDAAIRIAAAIHIPDGDPYLVRLN